MQLRKSYQRLIVMEIILQIIYDEEEYSISLINAKLSKEQVYALLDTIKIE